MRKPLLFVAVAAVGLLLGLGPVPAEDYPTRPIKMIVPFTPAGPIDTMARLIAQHLSEKLKQQVIVDNRPGAGSTIGVKAASLAEPDGYTLLFGSSGSLAVAPSLYSKLDYDTRTSFVPIATVALLPHVLVISPSLPVKSIQEFIDYAKARPGKLNYGAGLGTPPHLLSTLFKVKTDIDIVFIPYKGAAQSITDLLAGRTQMTIDGLTVLYPLIEQGKLRALAVATEKRWHALPDVPTLKELGYPEFVTDAWTGVVAPAGTPPAIVAKLNATINEGLRSQPMQANLARFSAIPKIGTPEDFKNFLDQQIKVWGGLVELAHARIN
jgi:tripartite-type tricarboxylate transporter receptor subunit TctC